MPKRMPALAAAFGSASGAAVDFARGVEAARSHLAKAEARRDLPVARLELSYELAYLRAFAAWEQFLEEGFLRYLCGYSAGHGQERLAGGAYYGTLELAKAAVYGNQQYILWHNPQRIVQRANQFFSQTRHGAVIGSMQGRIQSFAAIRHRIAHAHGRDEFDAATMSLAGKRYPGARPGRFLRDWAPHTPQPTRWIDVITTELHGLAHQIVPQ